jgi:hypothetical protein
VMSDALLARVGPIVSVSPGRVERVEGAREPITVHRVLDVSDAPALHSGPGGDGQ